MTASVTVFCLPIAYHTFAREYVDGCVLVTPSTCRIPPQSLEAKAKITNKMNHTFAVFEAKQVNPRATPLMLDLDTSPGSPLATTAWKSLPFSGAQAVMVSDQELCGGECLKAANCSTRGSYHLDIYIRSGNGWRKALSTESTGEVFLSTDWSKPPLRSRR